MDDQSLAPEELQKLTHLLAKLEPGFLPFSVFHEITRLVATPIIEIVPLRVASNNSVEILLLKRDENDPVWPNKLHVPGTVVRSSDSKGDFSEAFGRIFKGELSLTISEPPTFVKNVVHHSGRGMEVSQIFWASVDQSSSGQFYDVAMLPSELVDSQLDFIPAAIEHFKSEISHQR